MSARDAIAAAIKRLESISETPEIDTDILMAHALGISIGELRARADRLDVPAGFTALIDRRVAHEPVAYITGNQPFWNVDIAVGPGVLIPRADSETLIEAAVARFGDAGPARILDLGSGPGTLLIAALTQWPLANGIGIERSAVARDYARTNAERNRVAARVRWQAGDWTQAGWAAGLGIFDLILANPPYVESAADLARQVEDYEPAEALFAGPEGLDDYRRLLPVLPSLLAPGGIAAIEIGWRQARAVSAIAAAAGFAVTVQQDLGGRDRALICSIETINSPQGE